MSSRFILTLVGDFGIWPSAIGTTLHPKPAGHPRRTARPEFRITACRSPRGILRRQPIQAIEGCGLVALRQRRVVEDRLDDLINASTERQHGLPDVDQLRGLRTDDVHAEE